MRREALLAFAPALWSVASGCATSATAELRVFDAPSRPRAEEARQAIASYDLARIERLWRARLEELEFREEAERATLHEFGRLAHAAADAWKLRETTAADAASRDLATERRLAIVRASLPLLRAGLETAPDDPELLFTAGELLAFRIDGVVSGLQWGPDSEALLRRSPLPEARLALAKRLYYLPGAFGGDLEGCVDALRVLLEEYPDLEPGWAFLGQALVAVGDVDAAYAALERALVLNPNSLRGRVFLERLAGAEARP